MKNYSIIARHVIVWMSVAFTSFYVYAYMFLNPYTGLVLQPVLDGWQVRYVEDCTSPCPIYLNDIIVQVGEIPFEETLRNRMVATFIGYEAADIVPILVLRQGDKKPVLWTMPAHPDDFLLQRMLIVLFTLPFILFALASEYLIPRTRAQTLLVAGFLSYAAFISSGLLSPTLIAFSSIAMHMVVWLSASIMIELHWQLPTPLSEKLPYRGWFYTSIILVMVLELFQVLPWRLFYLAILLQILICTGLLLWRVAQGIAARQSIIMMAGMWLAWLPGLLWMSVSYEVNAPDLIYTTIVTMMFLVWPLFYLYANYRHALGRMEGAARKVVILAGFGSIALGVLAVAAVIIGGQFNWTPYQIVANTVIGTILTLLVGSAYGWFDRLANNKLYGRLNNALSELSGSLFNQLPDLIDEERIRAFLAIELHETLQVDEMALYYENGGEVCLVFSTGCEVPLILEAPFIFGTKSEAFSEGITGKYSWVRVSFPMIIGDRILGCFLIGARQDDDYYALRHIDELQHIVNGLAAALELNKQRASIETQLDVIIAQERMAALGRLAANIAHQINNPLQTITGALDAHSDFSDTGPVDPYLKTAYEKTAYLSDIVRSIIQFVHRGNIPHAEVDVNECVKSVLPLIDDRVRTNNVSVGLHLAASLPPVQASRSDLPQVITNLIENACDAMPHGGDLLIETAIDSDREHAIIRISDTGIGISKSQMTRLFEPFYTTKQNGTGFGLAIAYSIIERNNGRLTVESKLGQGSTFVIQLPIEVTEREIAHGDYFNRR
jgi:signal transduction histidine kinase